MRVEEARQGGREMPTVRSVIVVALPAASMTWTCTWW